MPVVSDVDEVSSEVTSSFSLTSRTPSMVSIHSRHSTVAPLSPGFLDRMELRFGPDWRDLLR